MTGLQAQAGVVTMLTLTGALALAGDVTGKHPSPEGPIRVGVAIVIAGIGLTALAGPAPAFAFSLAALVLTSTALAQADTLTAVTKYL